MKKIIEDKTYYVINLMKQAIKQIEENKNYDFPTEEKC